MKFLRFLPVLLAFFLITNCSKREEQAVADAEEWQVYPGPSGPSGPAWHALALLKTGDNPLWFELGSEGPLLVGSPASAALAPYTPWPHARYISGMQEWEGFVVMAVNRDGFLVLGSENPAEEETADLMMYRVAGNGFWEPYTAGSFFIWDDKPAILLYRNDFFSDEGAPPLANQVFVLDRQSSVPLAARVNALESFPPGGPWEAEVLHRGPDGLWYYRMREKDKPQRATAFFRTGDLSKEGERISDDEWRNSFSGAADIPEEGDLPFRLPALPEDFVYTGIAQLGEVLVATWEEQQLPAVGAAGFMVVRNYPPGD